MHSVEICHPIEPEVNRALFMIPNGFLGMLMYGMTSAEFFPLEYLPLMLTGLRAIALLLLAMTKVSYEQYGVETAGSMPLAA